MQGWCLTDFVEEQSFPRNEAPKKIYGPLKTILFPPLFPEHVNVEIDAGFSPCWSRGPCNMVTNNLTAWNSSWTMPYMIEIQWMERALSSPRNCTTTFTSTPFLGYPNLKESDNIVLINLCYSEQCLERKWNQGHLIWGNWRKWIYIKEAGNDVFT